MAFSNRAEADRVFAEAIPAFGKMLSENKAHNVVELNPGKAQLEERPAAEPSPTAAAT